MERGAQEISGGEDAKDSGGMTPEGAGDGTENERLEAADAPEPEPGEGADQDAGGNPEGDGEDGGNPDGDDGAPETGDGLEQLRAKVMLLESQLKSRAGEERDQAQAQPPAPMTDEQWAGLEEKWGGMPRTQIQSITNQNMKVMDVVIGEMNKRLAKFEKSLVMDDMAKDPRFANIRTLGPDIEEYLGNFDASQHSNRELLTHAY